MQRAPPLGAARPVLYWGCSRSLRLVAPLCLYIRCVLFNFLFGLFFSGCLPAAACLTRRPHPGERGRPWAPERVSGLATIIAVSSSTTLTGTRRVGLAPWGPPVAPHHTKQASAPGCARHGIPTPPLQNPHSKQQAYTQPSLSALHPHPSALPYQRSWVFAEISCTSSFCRLRTAISSSSACSRCTALAGPAPARAGVHAAKLRGVAAIPPPPQAYASPQPPLTAGWHTPPPAFAPQPPG